MMRQLTIGLLLALAIFSAPLLAPTQICAMGPVMAPSVSCTDCCAAMKSCVLAQQNPTNSVAVEASAHVAFIAIAPAATVLFQDADVTPQPYGAAKRSRSLSTLTSRAFLCTFLI